MSITFKCSGCDQALKVPDRMAGNKGKCPKCGSILRVPGAREEEPEEPARPAPRKARAPQRAIIEEKALRKRPPAAETVDDDDGEAPEEAVPRTRKGRKKKTKKRKKSSLLLVGLLSGGFALLLACAGLGGLVWWYFFAAGDDLIYMPNNCEMVASVRVDQLLQSQSLQELRREIPDFDKGFQMGLDKGGGISTMDIDHFVIGIGSNSKSTVSVVHTKKTVEASDIRSKIPNANYTETKIGKYVLHDPQNSSSPAFCILDKKRLVIGDKEAVREVLQRNKKPEFSKNMQDALKQVDFSKTIALASDLQSASSKVGGGLPMLGANNKMGDALKKVNSVVVHATVSSEVRYEVTLLCQDAAAANDIKTQIESALNDFKKWLETLQAMQGNKQGMPKEVNDLLQLNLKVNGNKVTGGNSFKVSGLIQMYKQQKGKP
jgi:hypothetical protein